MRIIAGKHRGRNIATLEGKKMRPTTSMVREAVFNILMHRKFGERTGSIFENCVVADLFCGSGALGLEALSRGAEFAFFVDIDASNLEVARANVRSMKEMEKCQFFRSDSTMPPLAPRVCDLVFIDPPYNSGMVIKTLLNMKNNGWLKKGSVVVIEISKQEDIILPEGFLEITERSYGITKVMVVEVGE